MTTAPNGIAGVFDRAADTYDAVGVEWFGPIGQRLVDELAPAAGERALDIGCGRGAALQPLAEAVGPTGTVLGIDLSPRMVAATAVDVRDLAHVQVRVADASAPGLPASSYDVVASSLVLFFLPDPAAAVRAWQDLLAPGGRLGVSTFGAQDERWKAIDALFTPHLPQDLLDARTSGRVGPFASDEGVEGLLAGAGLVEVRTVRWRLDAAFSDPEQWLRWSWSHGQRAMWEAVPADLHEQVQREAFTLLDGFRDTDGGIAFGQDVRLTLGRRA
jgi:ubiquinone/menaquinone biosynthesis C-methylase UbiE